MKTSSLLTRGLLFASLTISPALLAQTAGAPKQPIDESLKTEAAAKGATEDARSSLEGALELALAARETSAQIRDAGHWNRLQVANAVEARLNISRAGLSRIRSLTGDLADEVRARVNTSLDAATSAEFELQGAIRAARNSEEEARWTAVRDELAQRYDTFVAAVMNAATVTDGALAQAAVGTR